MGLSCQTLLKVQRRNGLKIVNKIFFFIFLMKKIDGFSIVVGVSIPVRLKLSSRVCHFGQNSGQKVLPCRHFVERRPLDFGL